MKQSCPWGNIHTHILETCVIKIKFVALSVSQHRSCIQKITKNVNFKKENISAK